MTVGAAGAGAGTEAGNEAGAEPGKEAATARLRRLLARPGFRALFASRLVSQSADGIFQASLVSYVLFSPERATSPGRIAASLAIVLLPFSVVGPFAGIVIDRVSRQRVLAVSGLVRAVLVVGLVGLIAAGHTGVDFYVLALAVFSVNRFVLSALSAGLPVVVEQADLVGANALSTTSGTVATLVGAGVGSGLRGLIGGSDRNVAVVAALAALVYLAAGATAGRAPRWMFGPVEPPPPIGIRAEIRQVAAGMAAGAAHLWSRRRARDALATLTVSRAGYGFSFVATILLYRNYFHGTNSGIGGLAAIVAASGVGTVAAAFATPRATRRIGKDAWIALVLVAAGVAQLGFGLPFTPGWFLVAAPVVGFAMQGAKICVDTIVQEQVDDAYRGRAFSLYDLLFNVAYVLAAIVGALTLPETGHSVVMLVITCAVYALSAVVYLVSRPAAPAGPAAATPERRSPAPT